MGLLRTQQGVFLFIVFSTLFIFCICDNVEQYNKPNILFILADDVGNSDVSFNARKNNVTPPILTPNIDQLAYDGLSLMNYYANPICGPTRASILTGRYNFRWGNPFPARNHGDLIPGAKTIADELKTRGYTNHFVGKWGIDKGNQDYSAKEKKFLKPTRKGFGPLDRGFDTFYGLYQSAHNHYTKKFFEIVDWHRHNETHQLDYPEINPETHEFSSDLFTKETIELIHQHSKNGQRENSPFFIHLSYTAPHDPLQSPEKYMNNPSCINMKNERRKIYCGMVISVDEGIKQIITELENTNLMENTIIIFTSDNGGYPYVGGFNYPFKGVKQTVYEGGVHCPALIKAPERFHLGEKQKNQSYFGKMHAVDWSATLIGLVDKEFSERNDNSSSIHLNVLENLDGIDLSDAFRDGVSKRNSIVIHVENYLNITAFIYGKHKLILGELSRDSDVFLEPNDHWVIHSDQRNIERIIRELLTDGLEHLFGPDSWPYQWATHFMVEQMFRESLLNFWFVPLFGIHPDGPVTSDLETRPLVLPIPQWNSDLEVQLYDLELDPFESNDISNQNRDLVDSIIKEFHKELLKGPDPPLPQIGAIIFNFGSQMSIFRILIGCIIFGIPVLSFSCIFLCCCLKQNNTKVKLD